MMKKKLLVLAVSLCMILALAISASAATVAYYSHNGGSTANDGLTESAPKTTLGAVSGKGIASVLKDGGTLVVIEKMYIGSNYKWDVDGETTITAVYGGKDFKNPSPANDPAAGVIKFKPNITWSIASDVILDNIMINMDAVISVEDGATLIINENVQTIGRSGNYSSIVVEKGSKVIVNGGTFQSVSGNGEIVIGASANILETVVSTGSTPAPSTSASTAPTVTVDGPVAYMSHKYGASTNDGLTDATPKTGFGSASGTGVISILYDGGTLVACEKSYLSANYKWNLGGEALITAVYGGKDYRNPLPENDPASGVFKMKSGVTFTVASDLTFDCVYIVQDAEIVVARGATLTITDTVVTVPRAGVHYADIFVEKGATAVINGGTYKSIEGNGRITIGENVVVLEGENATVAYTGNVNTPTTPTVSKDGAVAYMSHNNGSNSNDGLTPSTAKSGWGNTTGNGVAGILKDGGTLVTPEKMYLGVDYKWSVNGKTVITAVYGGKDYRNATPANNPTSGVLKFKPNVTFTIASDVTFDSIILFQEANIVVAKGATLTVNDTVQTLPRSGFYPTITVEKGGKAIVNGGTFEDITGEGDITVGAKATVLSEVAKSTVAYYSHNKGSSKNDGLTDATPKNGFGSATGTGVISILSKGGTLVVSEKAYLGANYQWNVDGDVTVTAVYGGKDYRNPEPANDPASGVFKFKTGVTLTVSSNLTFENVILSQDATILVAPGATLTVADTVSTVGRGENYLNIIVSSGAKAVINGGTYQSITGNGDITVGDKVKVVGSATADQQSVERVVNVCFIDNANGDNANDGSSAQKAVKNYGNGLFKWMPVGGTVVISGKSHIYASGNPAEFNFTTFAKPVTITSVYGGVDYRTTNADAIFSIEDNTVLHIYSDITFDNITLVSHGDNCKIYVHSGAMLSVTDTVEFRTNTEGGKHFTVHLEKGAYAHLSAKAAEKLTVVGEGESLPYVNGATDVFDYALGTKTMVQLTIGSTTAYVNGVAHTLDAAPLNRNNRTMLPVRFLANAFGIADEGIAWDPATRTATLTGKDVNISITVGASSMLVNGKTVALDSPAFIEKNRTYLPVRAIANALGVSNDNIGWMAATNTATLLK